MLKGIKSWIKKEKNSEEVEVEVEEQMEQEVEPTEAVDKNTYRFNNKKKEEGFEMGFSKIKQIYHGLSLEMKEDSGFKTVEEKLPSYNKPLEPIADFLMSIGVYDKRSLGVCLFIERPSESNSTHLIQNTMISLLEEVVNDMSKNVVFMKGMDFSNPDQIDIDRIINSYIINVNKGSVYIMNKLSSFPAMKDSNLGAVKNFFRLLNKSGPVVYVGTREELDYLKNSLGIRPNFYSNTDIEYTLSEAKTLIASELNTSTSWNNVKVQREDLKQVEQLLERGWKLNAHAIKQISSIFVERMYDFIYNKDKFDLIKSLNVKSSSELKLSQFVGMQNVKDKVEELEAYLHFQRGRGMKHSTRLHMVLEGSPGTGKTVVAREIARILYNLGYIRQDKLTEVAAEDLASQYVGMSAIKTRNLVSSAMGGVLFIDEAYALTNNKHGYESLASLIKVMEDSKDDLIVIFAGYEKEMAEFLKVNPGLDSRIAFRFKFEDYTPEELVEILKQKVKKDALKGSEMFYEEAREDFKAASQNKGFGNGRYVEKYLQQKIMQHSLEVFKGEREDSTLLIAESEKNHTSLKASS